MRRMNTHSYPLEDPWEELGEPDVQYLSSNHIVFGGLKHLGSPLGSREISADRQATTCVPPGVISLEQPPPTSSASSGCVNEAKLFRHHENNPRFSRGQKSENKGPVTSLMIRHIPCSVDSADLSSAIDEIGFKGKYDFLHVPRALNRKTRPKSNRGYAFVNFLTEEDAQAFSLQFESYLFAGSRSVKKCEVQLASVQGKNQMEAAISAMASMPSATTGLDEVSVYTGNARLVDKIAVRQAPTPKPQSVKSLADVVDGKTSCLHEVASLPILMKSGFPHALSGSDSGSSTRGPLSFEEEAASQPECAFSDGSSDSSSDDSSEMELWMDKWFDPQLHHLEQASAQLQYRTNERQQDVKAVGLQEDSVRVEIEHNLNKPLAPSHAKTQDMQGENLAIAFMEEVAASMNEASCFKVCMKNTFLHVETQIERKICRSSSDSDLLRCF